MAKLTAALSNSAEVSKAHIHQANNISKAY